MNPIQQLVDYVRSSKAEALKVSWPSKQETIRYSSIVIGASVAIALAFGAIDYGFTSLFNATLLQKVAENRAAQQAQETAPKAEPEKPKIELDTTGGDVQVTP